MARSVRTGVRLTLGKYSFLLLVSSSSLFLSRLHLSSFLGFSCCFLDGSWDRAGARSFLFVSATELNFCGSDLHWLSYSALVWSKRSWGNNTGEAAKAGKYRRDKGLWTFRLIFRAPEKNFGSRHIGSASSWTVRAGWLAGPWWWRRLFSHSLLLWFLIGHSWPLFTFTLIIFPSSSLLSFSFLVALSCCVSACLLAVAFDWGRSLIYPWQLAKFSDTLFDIQIALLHWTFLSLTFHSSISFPFSPLSYGTVCSYLVSSSTLVLFLPCPAFDLVKVCYEGILRHDGPRAPRDAVCAALRCV